MLQFLGGTREGWCLFWLPYFRWFASSASLGHTSKHKYEVTMAQDDEEPCCAICLEPLDVPAGCYATPCGHRFHSACFHGHCKVNLRRHDMQVCCPTCRTPGPHTLTDSEVGPATVTARELLSTQEGMARVSHAVLTRNPDLHPPGVRGRIHVLLEYDEDDPYRITALLRLVPKVSLWRKVTRLLRSSDSLVVLRYYCVSDFRVPVAAPARIAFRFE